MGIPKGKETVGFVPLWPSASFGRCSRGDILSRHSLCGPGFGQQGRWQRRSKRDDWSLWYSRVGTAWSWSVGSCLGL